MFYADSERKRYTKWRIDLAIHDALAIACKRSSYQAFQRLLAIAVSRSDLLCPFPTGGYAGWEHANRILRGLLSLCDHRRNWLRAVDEWDVPAGSLLQQFGSLAEHLLASHPIPNFMRLVWFEELSESARRHQKLFKHLALGNNIRGAEMPIRLTKSMAGYFAVAPDHLTVEQAVRWSQIRGLGGDKSFASSVLSTRLGTVFENESFWAETFRFLIAQPKLDCEMIPPIIDFLNSHQDGLATRPSQHISERDFGSFLRRVQKWMDRNPNYGRRAKLRWPRTSIAGFRHVESQKREWSVRYWTIRELTDRRELIDEGNGLHHCVATYAKACANRTTSIWSLQCHGSFDSHRVLTIELIPDERRIITALGKCNSSPNSHARKIMQMWARQEGLTVARWV